MPQCNRRRACQCGGTGLGLQSCNEFGKFYSLDPKKTELEFYTWASGFLSGLEFMSDVDNEISRLAEGTMI